VILAGLLAALAWEAWDAGVIIDGPSHLLSAYLYWHGADNLRPGDMPPLIKIVGGWVPSLFRLPIPYDNEQMWASQNEWRISGEMIARMSGPQIHAVFFCSRLPFLIFPLLTALLIWRWARERFSAWVGVLLVLAYAFEPTALAHGPLFKNDLAATFTYLLFWYRAWKFWKDPRLRNTAWMGLALLLAILAKMSMLFLMGVAPLLVILRYATLPPRRLRPAIVPLLLVLLIPYLGAIAAYQFRTRRIPAAEMAAYARDPALPKPLLVGVQVFRVLPVPWRMWVGVVSLFQSGHQDNPVYLLGRRYVRGHPLYFLVALALKIPIPLQILMACSAALLAIGWKRRGFQPLDLFWLLPPLVYILLASLTPLQYGVRLVLPALPFGLLLCGVAIAEWIPGRRIAVVACLLTWLAVRSAEIYPHGISFFNLWIGGPESGLQYLADSNVDWGQDLAELAEFTKAHDIRKIYLSYFGNDNPYRYFSEDQLEVIAPPWDRSLAKGPVYEPGPGFYAISANLLPGHFFGPQHRDYYKVFREMEPIAKAGYSIHIYLVER
jgi:hypothetical protein